MNRFLRTCKCLLSWVRVNLLLVCSLDAYAGDETSTTLWHTSAGRLAATTIARECGISEILDVGVGNMWQASCWGRAAREAELDRLILIGVDINPRAGRNAAAAIYAARKYNRLGPVQPSVIIADINQLPLDKIQMVWSANTHACHDMPAILSRLDPEKGILLLGYGGQFGRDLKVKAFRPDGQSFEFTLPSAASLEDLTPAERTRINDRVKEVVKFMRQSQPISVPKRQILSLGHGDALPVSRGRGFNSSALELPGLDSDTMPTSRSRSRDPLGELERGFSRLGQPWRRGNPPPGYASTGGTAIPTRQTVSTSGRNPPPSRFGGLGSFGVAAAPSFARAGMELWIETAPELEQGEEPSVRQRLKKACAAAAELQAEKKEAVLKSGSLWRELLFWFADAQANHR